MAWLEKSPNGRYHVAFRYGGLKYKKALRTCDPRTAHARAHRLSENIRLLETGRLALPDDADLGALMLSDGKLNTAQPAIPKRKLRSVGQLSAVFLESIPEGGFGRALDQGDANTSPTCITRDQAHDHFRRAVAAPAGRRLADGTFFVTPSALTVPRLVSTNV